MTKQEAAICSLYTGYAFLAGDDLQYVYDYAAKLMGRPVYTHELAMNAELFKKLAEPDFMRLCRETREQEDKE